MQNLVQLFNISTGDTGQRIINFSNRLQKKTLNLEIKITFENLSKLENQFQQVKDKAKQMLPNHIFIEFNNRQTLAYNKRFKTVKNRNINKIKNLSLNETKKITVKDNWFKNISNVTFPDEIKNFLALGPKFSVPPIISKIPIRKILADLEFCMSQFNETDKNLKRAQVTNIITNFLHKNRNNNSPNTQLFLRSKRFLKEHPDLLIIKSDKGNVTVAMNKTEYHRLSIDILSDERYYSKLRTDPICTIQQKANKLVSELKRNNIITKEVASTLTIYNSVAPKFYGLPKIHKPTLSLRPIISSVNSPNVNISQFITNILTNSYVTNDYYIKDSFEFTEFINEKQLPNNYVIISLDVVSLFSNIPLDLVIKSIQDKWQDISNSCNMTQNKFIDIIKFIFDTTYFQYDNIFYKQILGTPMGGKISPIIAQYVMDMLLDSCIPKLSFHLPFIKKYVDDIICAVPQGSIQEILEVFNGYNNFIQFTVEEETNNSVPFLDTRLIRRGDNTLITDWYQKPTSSGRFISYHSYHNTKMKINLVMALRNRIQKISHASLRENNINKLFQILVNNSYPPKLMRKLLYSNREHNVTVNHTNNGLNNNDNSPKIYRSLPHIENLTSRLIKVFKDCNIQFAKKNLKIINELYSTLKDPTQKGKMSNIVYKIPCRDCDQCYIGQSSRPLHSRIISHRSDCRTKSTACALASHVINNKHEMNYEDSSILDIETNYTKRTFLEMVHINSNNNTMNRRSDINNLSIIYNYVLKLNN